jgi:hypothetical protein
VLLAALLQPVLAWGLLPGRAPGAGLAQAAVVCVRAGVEVQLAPAEARLRLADVKNEQRPDAIAEAAASETEPPARHLRSASDTGPMLVFHVPEQSPVRGPPSSLLS